MHTPMSFIYWHSNYFKKPPQSTSPTRTWSSNTLNTITAAGAGVNSNTELDQFSSPVLILKFWNVLTIQFIYWAKFFLKSSRPCHKNTVKPIHLAIEPRNRLMLYTLSSLLLLLQYIPQSFECFRAKRYLF